VPRDKGYRIYVETVTASLDERVSPWDRDNIHWRLSEVERDLDEWTRAAAALLAGMVGNMAIATYPKARESRVMHVELVGLQDLLALLIVVFQQAKLRKQLVRLKEPTNQNDLQSSANKLSELLVGLSSSEIESKEMELSPFEKDLVNATTAMLKEEDRAEYSDHRLGGLRNLLGQPEFSNKETVQELVERVENGSLAQAILNKAPETGSVRVVIGQENREDMLWPLSIVIVPYGIPGEATGAVGVVGPVRMEYGRAIAGVELMARIMGELVESVHG
jgi:heat-inducible transcriptional repressor